MINQNDDNNFKRQNLSNFYQLNSNENSNSTNDLAVDEFHGFSDSSKGSLLPPTLDYTISSQSEALNQTKDKNLRYCIYCQQHKVRKFSGKKSKDGSKVYVDDNNYRWAGKRCPDCEKKRVKAANRHDKFERQSIVDTLKAQGFNVISTASPMLVKKNGAYFSVGIQRAYAKEKGKIILENPTEVSEKTHLTALLFQTTKLVDNKQLQSLNKNAEFFQK